MKINGLKLFCTLCDVLVKTIAPRNSTEYNECRSCCSDCMVDSIARERDENSKPDVGFFFSDRSAKLLTPAGTTWAHALHTKNHANEVAHDLRWKVFQIPC